MTYLPIRPTLFVLALAVTACRDNAATDAVAPRAPRPSFALDLAAPPAPTNVTAELTPIDRYRATFPVSWMDNSTALDECSTVVYATTTDGASAGGEGLYATNYDLPPGSR